MCLGVSRCVSDVADLADFEDLDDARGIVASSYPMGIKSKLLSWQSMQLNNVHNARISKDKREGELLSNGLNL